MRKLMLVVVLGFSLVGYGESKVSDEMFAGDWTCEVTAYTSNWDNNYFGKFEKFGDINVSIWSFKYENDFLYSKNLDINEEWGKVSLVEVFNNKTLTEESEYVFDKITRSLDVESNDQFIITYERESISKDDKYSLLNLRDKTETICKRL